MRTSIFTHVRRRMVRGLLLVLPLLITLWLLSILFDLIDRNITPMVLGVLQWANVPWLDSWIPRRVLIPLIGVVLTGAFIYLLGLMAGNLAGRRILNMIEGYILRIPVVKGVYGAARQLLDAFSMTGTKAFSKVVILEYPRKELWTLAFVTSEVEHEIGKPDGGEVASTVPVFLPTTPNPTSGWMLLVPRKDLLVLDMTIEDAVKLIVSGGIVSPENLGRLIRDWRSGPELPPPPG